MGFVFKQVSDVGSSNPIVARLSLQFGSILDFFDFDKETKDSIQFVLSSDIQKRLVVCDKLAKEIIEEIQVTLSELNKNGVKTQSNGRVVECPHIINLNERLEIYLYNTKSCLRDSLKIYNIAFNAAFTEARYDLATEWAEKEFGKDDPITKFLRANNDRWIRRLVRMRNAIEHPGGHSGSLYIRNFEVVTNEGSTLIHEPLWHLNKEDPAVIRNEIHRYVIYILELVEDIVLSVLSKQKQPQIVQILEIPENQRRLESPIRFRMGLPRRD